jgi:acetyl-CoA acyltransferase
MNPSVVLIDGRRTAFLKLGTDYSQFSSYQLAASAILGLLRCCGLDGQYVDQVVMGTVIHNMQTANVAREAALTAGLPCSSPCHTVSQACISANQAICQAADSIRLGHAQVVVAGGTDCASDTPIVFRKAMRNKLMAAQKLRGLWEYLRFAMQIRPADFLPQRPAVAEHLTGRLMGEDCEMLAARFGITRAAQDEYAARSHHLADQATKAGQLQAQITSVGWPLASKAIAKDNGIRPSSLETLAALKPAFVKHHGTITAANASFLTDGAAAVLLTSESRAHQLGLKPKAVIRDYLFTGQDLFEELLLGPAYAIARLLSRNRLTLDEIDVFELHEAFAGQVLANLTALGDDTFCRDKLGLPAAVGQLPLEKLNCWGGSLAIGHPFGATGARLVTTAANRLHHQKGRWAIVAACAAGAHGHAMLLERSVVS